MVHASFLLFLGAEPVAAVLRPFEILGRHLGDEAAGFALDHLAVFLSCLRVADGELLFGAGDADIGQPPFLLNPFLVLALEMGDGILLEADQVDMGELQSLGGVEGHQLHAVGRLVVVAVLENRHQGQLGDQPVQGRLLLLFLQVADPAYQFFHIGHARFGLFLRAAGVAQPVLVSQFLDEQPGQAHGIHLLGLTAFLLQPVGETLQVDPGLARQLLFQPVLVQYQPEIAVTPGGVLAQGLQGGGADLASRRVDDAQQGAVVLGVGDDAQVGGQILDLAAFEEGGAAGDLVGHRVLAQQLFVEPGLMVAAIENGEVLPGRALEMLADDVDHHLLGLVLVVAAGQHAHEVAIAGGGPEFLVEQVRIVADDPVGHAQDAAGRAVVLLQLDHLQRREILLQQADVLGTGAAPGIDGLVVVADHGELLPHSAQQLDQLVLAGVGILVLVDQQVMDALAPLVQHLGLLTEQLYRQHDEIVEIHRVAGLQLFPVGEVDTGLVLLETVFGGSQRLFRRDEIILPLADAPLGLLDQFGLGVVLVLQFGDAVLGIPGIEYAEALAVAEMGMLVLQDVQSQGVEGGDAQAACLLLAEQFAGTLLHFLRRLVGEGDGADLFRPIAALADQPGDLLGDHAGLAAAGPGQHQTGLLDGHHGLSLGFIEVLQLHGRYSIVPALPWGINHPGYCLAQPSERLAHRPAGLAGGGAPLPVAQFRCTAARQRRRAAGGACHQPAARAVWRRFRRGFLLQPAGPVASSLFRGNPRDGGIGPLPDRAGRPPDPVRFLRRSCLACRRFLLAGAGALQRFFHRRGARGL